MTRNLYVGYFGASTGVAAALVAAAERQSVVKALIVDEADFYCNDKCNKADSRSAL